MEFWYPKTWGNVIIVVKWFGGAALCIETQENRNIVTPKLMTRESLMRWHTQGEEKPWYLDYDLDQWALECAE
jgi:hypothetical protein